MDTPATSSELREVAALAVDIQGQNDLLGYVSAAEVAEYLQRCVEASVEVCRGYGGHIVRRHIAGITALFGVSKGQEREVETAVRAAVAITDRLQSLTRNLYEETGRRLCARAGLDLGVIRLSPAGLGYDIGGFGPAVDNASKLKTRASPGAIVLSAAAFAQVRSVVKARPLPSVGVPDSAGSATAFVFDGFRAFYDGALSARGTFVGRGTELATLLNVLDGVIAGGGRVLGIVGPPGIGKTRLLAECFLKRREVRIYSVKCLPAAADVPYRLAAELLAVTLGTWDVNVLKSTAGDLLTGDRGELTEDILLLDEVLGRGVQAGVAAPFLSGSAKGERVAALISSLLIKASPPQTSVFVCEDVQWASASDLAFLKKFAREILEHRRALIVTGRDEKVLADIAPEVIALGPLTEEEVEALIISLLPVPVVGGDELEAAVKETAGIPAMCEEVAAVLRSGIACGGDKFAAVARAVRKARLDKLSSSALYIARTAACIGSEMTREFLEAALPDVDGESFAEALSELVAADIITDGETLSFKSEVARELILQGLVKEEREKRLRVIAQAALNLGMNPGIVAAYYSAAGETDRATAFLTVAAEEAAKLGALTEAATYYQRALENLADVRVDEPNKLKLLIDLATTLIEDGRPRQALDILKREYPNATTPYGRAEMSYYLGQAMAAVYEFGEAILLYQDACRLFSTLGMVKKEGDVWFQMARAAGAAGDSGRRRLALHYARRCFQRAGDESGKAYCDNAAGVDLLQTHSPRQALEYFLKARDAWRAAGDIRGESLALSNLAVVYGELGKVRDAAATAEKSLALARRVGTKRYVAINASNLAAFYAFININRARKYYRVALDLAAELDDAELLAGAYVNLAELERQLGEWDAARADVRRGWEAAFKARAEERLFYSRLVAAKIEVDCGTAGGPIFKELREELLQLEPPFKDTADLAKACLDAAAAIATEDRQSAEESARQIKTVLQKVQKVDEVLEGRITLGDTLLFLGDGAGAAVEYEKVVAVTEGENYLFWPRATYGLGRSCLALGQRAEAATYFDVAAAVFRAFGNDYWAKRVAAFRASSGL